MIFHYIAAREDGQKVEEELEAKDVGEVLKMLSARRLKPISVQKKGRGKGGLGLFGGRIALGDQVFLSKYLALMLKIGTGLLQAINILIEDFDKPAIKSFLMEVKSNLEKGQPFYAVFMRHSREFSQVYVNLVKAGEASGNLEKTFENLTLTLAKEKELRDQIKSALIYPIILLVASIIILFFLVTFALPRISKVFADSGFDPPTFSKVVFGIGAFFERYGIAIFGLGFIMCAGCYYLFRSSLGFKKIIVGLINEIPVVKDLTKKIAIQRFARTLSSLIRAGIPLSDAIAITADTVGRPELKEALERISKEGLSKGVTVGDAFKKEPFFPRTVVNLISISEKAGHMEEVLDTLADFYASEIESALKALVAFLEPALLMMIGLIIGGIALAIVVPIYQLTTQF